MAGRFRIAETSKRKDNKDNAPERLGRALSFLPSQLFRLLEFVFHLAIWRIFIFGGAMKKRM